MKSTSVVALAAFALGYLAGQAGMLSALMGEAARPTPDLRSSADASGGTGSAPGTAAHADTSGRVGPGSTVRADADGLPSAEEIRAYESLRHGLEAGRGAAARDALLARVRAAARGGRGPEALALVQVLANVDPMDAPVRLLESELLQQQGRLVDAIDPLLAVLAAGDDPPHSEIAREQLRLLVNVLESQLANRRDYPGLLRFFEDLVARDSGYDGHRLRLARWLVQAGRIDDAERVAREIGASGVTDAEREDLLAEIKVAREGLPLERSERGLHVRGTVGGRPARFLVDTGADTTVVSAAFARALGSRPVAEDVGVRTAGGRVSGALHRVRDLRVGGLRVPELEVLVLEHVPPDADGLLGMDVLGRVPPGMIPSALLGTPPASG